MSMTYKIMMSVGIVFFPVWAISADDNLCRDLVRNSFDRAISEISYPKALVEKNRLAVGSYIENNPIRFMKNGNIEVIGADLSTPVVKVDKDTEHQKTEFKPVKRRKSSLLVDRESTKREFPSLSDSEVEGCKIQTLELGSETEDHRPLHHKRITRENILTIHALFCADGIKAFKYKGETARRVFEKDSAIPTVNKSSSSSRGFIFESINGKCVLKTKSLLAHPSEAVGRTDCAKFYTLMNSPNKLVAPVSRDESVKDSCYTKPFEVVRGENLSSYIPNDIWDKMSARNIEELAQLTKLIKSKAIEKGNISLAESLEPSRITEKDIIRGCKKEQVSLAQTVKTLENLCSDYRTFVPFVIPQSPTEPEKKNPANTTR